MGVYLLFIQALQLLPNVLVGGVDGSVDFLQGGEKQKLSMNAKIIQCIIKQPRRGWN